MRAFLVSWATLAVTFARESPSQDLGPEDSDPLIGLLQNPPVEHPPDIPYLPPRITIEDDQFDPMIALVQFEDPGERTFVETAHYVRPCTVPSKEAWLLQPVSPDWSSTDYFLSVVSVCYLILMAAMYRTLTCYCDEDIVSVRSPLILKMSSVTGLLSIFCTWFGPHWSAIYGPTWLGHFRWALAVVVPASILPNFARAVGLRSLYEQQQLILKSSEQCAANMPQDFRAKLFDFEEKVHQLGVSCSEHARAAVLLFLLTAVLANGVVLEVFQAECPVEKMGITWGIATPIFLTLIVGLVLLGGLIDKGDVHGAGSEMLSIGAAYVLLVKVLLFGPAQWYQVVVCTWILFAQLVPLLSMLASIHKHKILDWRAPLHNAPPTFSTFFSSPLCRGYFYKFVCASFHPEIPQFWQDLEEYQAHFDEDPKSPKSPKSRSSTGQPTGQPASSRPRTGYNQPTRLDHAGRMRVTARNLFNKYIREGALMHVDLPEAVTQEINYRLHSNNITSYTFVAAQAHAYSQLESFYADFLCHSLSSGCFSRAQGRLASAPF